MRAVALLGALALAACDQGTYLVVDINLDAMPQMTATAIDATMTNNGQHATAHFDHGGAGIAFPQSFYLAIEGERQGEVTVEITAKMSDGTTLSGDGHATIIPHSTVHAAVRIGGGGVMADGGVVPDLRVHRSLKFTDGAKWQADATPLQVMLGDLNGDTRVDVVVLAGDHATPFLQQRLSFFSQESALALDNKGGSGALADFDGDGRLDLAVTRYFGDSLVVARGNGMGVFVNPSTFPCPKRPIQIAAADFDHDRLLDVVASTNSPGHFNYLRGRGDAMFDAASTIGSGAIHGGLAAGDLNRDGNLDVVVPDSDAATVSVFLGDGKGSFTMTSTSTAGDLPGFPLIADVDADGFADVVMLNRTANSFTVLHGNGTGQLGAAMTFPTGKGADSPLLADFDLDGWLDYAVAASDDNALLISRGGPGGVFTTGIVQPLEPQPVGIASTDFNHDGLPDLVAISQGQNTIQILLNISQ